MEDKVISITKVKQETLCTFCEERNAEVMVTSKLYGKTYKEPHCKSCVKDTFDHYECPKCKEWFDINEVMNTDYYQYFF